MSNSLRKGMNLLVAIAEKAGRDGIPLKDLAKGSEIPPSTAHRLLQILKEFDIVEQDPATQNYLLGPRLLGMGLKVRGWLDIRRVTLPVLRELTGQVEEDSYLTVAHGKMGVFIERVEGPYPVKVFETFGTQIPLHCGASRRAILSFLDEGQIRDYIKTDLVRYTRNTITDPEKLLKEIETVKKNGYAVSCNEYTDHGFGIAAPVRDYSGEVIASVGIIGLDARFTGERQPGLIENVLRAAEKLSAKMGYC